jgi:hypothetical protein
MRRAIRTQMHELEWTFVSERHPCPVCGGTADCQRASDDEFASCAKLPSEWRLTNGAWLHRIDAARTVSGVSISPVSVAAPLESLDGR